MSERDSQIPEMRPAGVSARFMADMDEMLSRLEKRLKLLERLEPSERDEVIADLRRAADEIRAEIGGKAK